MTMRMEKTRMPIGSRRRRPIGNFFRKPSTRQLTSLLVVQMMTVQSKSRAESTRDAIKERELDQMAATPLAARRRMFTITLICTVSLRKHAWDSVLTLIAHLACLADFARLLRSSSGRKGSKSSPLLPNGPRSSATPSPSTSRGFILSTMSSASEETTMSTSAQSSRRSFCSS